MIYLQKSEWKHKAKTAVHNKLRQDAASKTSLKHLNFRLNTDTCNIGSIQPIYLYINILILTANLSFHNYDKNIRHFQRLTAWNLLEYETYDLVIQPLSIIEK